ncbi:MAG: class I SAM-dependent methyltransferase [bacterium]|nr:class I SAM-dependent methyltransferase [bacterium]MBK8130914.1 class I SAM-dependent methyltransferase [bacterium]
MGFYREKILPRFLHRGLAAERHERYRAQAVAAARGRVLELGFGSGLNLKHLPADVTHVTGIEPNPGMRKIAVKLAHEYAFPVTLLDMDAQQLGFDDGEFDTVLSTWTMCSIPDLPRALAEAKRVLRRDGDLLFIEHGLASDRGVQKWQRRLTPVSKMLFDGCHTDRMISDFVRDAGFELVQLENFYAVGMPKSGGYMYMGRARKS